MTHAIHNEVNARMPSGFAWTFKRGFPGWVQTTIATFLEKADKLFAAGPVQEMELLGQKPGEMERLADSPHLARIRALSLRMGDVSAKAMRRLGESPHARGLRTLRLGDLTTEAAGPVALMGTPLFARMDELEIYGGFGAPIGDPIANAFARLGPIRLAALRLRVVELTPAGITRLARARAAASLTALELTNAPFADEPALHALASSGHLTGLRSLGLARTVTRLPELKSLLDEPVWKLRHLDLRWGKIGAQGIKVIQNCPATSELTALELQENPVGDGGAKALATSPASSHLASLDLQQCKIGDAGARALAESPHLDKLQYLALDSNPFGNAAGQALRKRFGKRVDFYELS
jgi:hypothetical protein